MHLSGLAHLVWRYASYSPTDLRIWYATNRPGSVWSTPASVSGKVASPPALAVSPVTEERYISHEEGEAESSEVYVAYRSGSRWLKDRLTHNTTFDRFHTIAVDTLGRVHVARIVQDASGDYGLVYAFGTIGNWSIQAPGPGKPGPSVPGGGRERPRPHRLS